MTTDWADEAVEKLRDEYFFVSESYPDHAVADALRETEKRAWNAAIEAAAKAVAPEGERPRVCDCGRCYYHNSGDLEEAAAWDASTARAQAIRALVKP